MTGRAGAIARKAIELELNNWRSLFRWIARRPRVPHGAAAFGYAAPVTTILIVFIVLSAVEIPIFDLILRPWLPVRIAAMVLGIWGLTFMLGLLAGFRVNPHVVADSGLLVRNGTTVDFTIPWDAVAGISARRHGLPESRTVQLTRAEAGTTLHLGMASETNVVVTLNRELAVALPKGDESVIAVHCYADDAPAFVAAARARMVPAAPPT